MSPPQILACGDRRVVPSAAASILADFESSLAAHTLRRTEGIIHGIYIAVMQLTGGSGVGGLKSRFYVCVNLPAIEVHGRSANISIGPTAVLSLADGGRVN
jgi:hypothetical protein